ncbi:MAG TPA: hypothetical protein VMR52_13320 [Dehalococcoidia bacterium]|nr:hypothetical protein [Dehalococcoidia bacterium]
MSLTVTVYVPSGIVMAADSRMSALRSEERELDGKKTTLQQQIVLSDSAYKILPLDRAGLGIAVYDSLIVDNQPIESHVQRFETEVLEEGDDIDAVTDKFMAYFHERYPSVPVGMHVAGYRTQGKARLPVVLVGHTVRETVVRRVNLNDQGDLQFGVVRAGDTAIVNRLINKATLPLFAAMPLQDAIDYAVHLIRTTIETMRFEPRFPSVGGPIDVLVIEPDGMRWVQRKELRAP